MKKLFLFLIIILAGCKCLSQIPPQYIYSQTSCSALLPDYRAKVSASDNCAVQSLTQTPAPGFVLDQNTMITNVTIKAIDKSGNFRQVVFSVALLDTVKPVLTIDQSLLGYTEDQMHNIYDAGDKLMARIMQEGDNDSSFYQQILVVTSQPSTRYPGTRNRTIAFADSVKIY